MVYCCMHLCRVKLCRAYCLGRLQEPPLVAIWVLILDPTDWLDGARPANTCIPLLPLDEALVFAHQSQPSLGAT
jgi:hypothetical protein